VELHVPIQNRYKAKKIIKYKNDIKEETEEFQFPLWWFPFLIAFINVLISEFHFFVS